jgi:hypothetical protein
LTEPQVTQAPELSRDAVIAVLQGAGHKAEAGRPRRRRDPEPSDGFRVFSEEGGTVMALWVPSGGVLGPADNALRTEAKRHAGEYAEVIEAAGWATEPGGLGDESPAGWHWIRVRGTGPGNYTEG